MDEHELIFIESAAIEGFVYPEDTYRLIREIERWKWICSDLQEICKSLADRVAAQSELLSKRSEKQEKGERWQ